MGYGEKGGFDGSSYEFPKEDNSEKKEAGKEYSVENPNFDVVEINNQETDFEIEITEADIEGIKYQIEEERKKEGVEGLGNSCRIELEAALSRMRKEAPEPVIEKMELTDDDVKKYNEKKDIDIDKAIEDKTKEGAEKGWDKEELDKEIESEKIRIEEDRASYLKDIFGEKRLREKGLEVSDEKWKKMEEDLEHVIKKGDWDEVITRAGRMNNLDSEKFEQLKNSDRNPFGADVKKSILQEIDLARKEGAGQEANPGKLAKDIEQISKCFPDIEKEIEISEKDWKIMLKYLDDVRKQDWGRKELTDFGKKGEYWKVAQTEASMKEIEKMIDGGEIKVSEELDNEEDSAVK